MTDVKPMRCYTVAHHQAPGGSFTLHPKNGSYPAKECGNRMPPSPTPLSGPPLEAGLYLSRSFHGVRAKFLFPMGFCLEIRLKTH